MDPENDEEVSNHDSDDTDMVVFRKRNPLSFFARHWLTVAFVVFMVLALVAIQTAVNAANEAKRAQKIACESFVHSRDDLRDILLVSISRSTNQDAIAFANQYLDEKLPPTKCVNGVQVPVKP